MATSCDVIIGNEHYSGDNTFDEEEEMFKEIQIGNAMTEIMEKEIKLIKLLKPITEFDINKIKISFIPSNHKNTLILDLDETLIYSFNAYTKEKTFHTLPIITVKYASTPSNSITHTQFVKRPFLETFLYNAAKLYEIIVNSLYSYSLQQKKIILMPLLIRLTRRIL